MKIDLQNFCLTCALFTILALNMSSVLSADYSLTPSELFSDNMVLQRDRPIPVWGQGRPEDLVTVTFGSHTASARVSETGDWRVILPPLAACFSPQEMKIQSRESAVNPIILSNILVGDVWLAGGQSNMAYTVQTAKDAAAEIAAADYPAIRVFRVKSVVAASPQKTLSGNWIISSPETANLFSATGYFFAREIHQTLNVPVGLIDTSVSGTPAEAWMLHDTLASNPDFVPILERFEEAVANYEKSSPTHASTSSNEAPDPVVQTNRPAGLMQGTILPVAPYAIRGIIWWQGEYNSERGEQYRTLFPALIQDWRKTWNHPALPFLFVQLQNFDIQPQPNPAHYDELREAQLMTLRAVPFTGMAVACDVGDPNDIHPPNKQPIGHRLALLARSLAYGETDLVSSGPLYARFKINGPEIQVDFDSVGSGLVLKNTEATVGFEIAGEDRRFFPAHAEVAGGSVIVTSPEVPAPVAVRYAWQDNPTCTLFNIEGLPASPFRTDDWPAPTTGKR